MMDGKEGVSFNGVRTTLIVCVCVKLAANYNSGVRRTERIHYPKLSEENP